MQKLAYTWDGFGNLAQRCDANRSLAENVSNDDLNRLTGSTVSTGVTVSGVTCVGGSATNTLGLVYDAMGNITTRSVNGTVETYTPDPSHPYAVASVTDSSGTIYSASYDNNGNMTTRNGYALTWTVDNLPESIGSANGSSTFDYGPDGNRYAQSATFNGNTTATAYIGGLFEVVSTATDTKYRHNIVADGQVIAVHTIDGSGSAYTDYLHYDHLGSMDAITNDSGSVIQAMSFDAFGVRRDASNWNYDLSQNQIATLKNYTDRGYTDQEQLDNLSLVDLNGRVYDPTVGRMISADPTVPDAFYSQAFNRFAYVYDSPLVYVDPSGYETALDCPKPDAVNIGGSVTRTELGPVHVSCPGPSGPGGGGGATPSGPTGPNPNPQPKPQPNPNNNPNNNPKPPKQPKPPDVPKNPCDYSRNAPSPQAYELGGKVLQAVSITVALLPPPGSLITSAVIQVGTLLNFSHGGALDAQAYGASPAYGNYAYGDFMSAAGYPLDVALLGANGYASVASSYSNKTAMNANYPSTPASNVTNIMNGYNAQANGTLCHK